MDKSKLPKQTKKSSVISWLTGGKKTKPGQMDDSATKRIRSRKDMLKKAGG